VPATPQNRDFGRVRRSLIHGKGVFAKRRIPVGTRVIEYTGARVPLATLLVPVGDGSTPHIYSFRLNDTTVIDGLRGGNESRFINHGCAPNCEALQLDGHMYI